MDKLANRLRDDANNIEVTVSDDLDNRISASLRSVTPQTERVSEAGKRRPPWFWWASSLTGIAAVAAVVVVINAQQPEEVVSPTPANIMAAVPDVDWQTETAALTGKLQQELDDLQSDIKKAEKKVREDIGF